MDEIDFWCLNQNSTLTQVYEHMIGKTHIYPGKCHEDKPLHIPIKIATKYDGTHSCSLSMVDLESLRLSRKMHNILQIQMLQELMILETFLTWLCIFKKCNLLINVFEDNFNKILNFSNYNQRTKTLRFICMFLSCHVQV